MRLVFLMYITALASTTPKLAMAVTQQPFQSTNPYRDLPEDPALFDVLRDVLYISDTLLAGLVPTSLPDEDDYAMYSSMLRSLETREDLTLLVIQETNIRNTVSSVAHRGRKHQMPIPEEPFDITSRAAALSKHWMAFLMKADTPGRWEAEFGTTLVPAILAATSVPPSDGPAFEYKTPEQFQDAEANFQEYISERAYAVSYFRRHPPRPMGFAPILPDEGSAKAAYDSLFCTGRNITMEDLDGNPDFRPMYFDLSMDILSVPFDWEDPEGKAAWVWSERRRRQYAEREERRKRQMKLQEELRQQWKSQAGTA